MDFSKFSDAELVLLRDKLQNFHTGIAGDIVCLDRSNMKIFIKDTRLNDLIFKLFIEAHNTLCNRFKNEIPSPDRPLPSNNPYLET